MDVYRKNVYIHLSVHLFICFVCACVYVCGGVSAHLCIAYFLNLKTDIQQFT